MAEDHRGRIVGNPNTSHGGHEPTPLENWNRFKTQGEKNKDRFSKYAQEITQNGGNPDALSSPYADPYDYEEPDESWRTIEVNDDDPRWRKK